MNPNHTHPRPTRPAHRRLAVTASALLLSATALGCAPALDDIATGCSASLAPSSRSDQSTDAGGPAFSIDPDGLPGIDSYGIRGPEAAALKSRVDAISPTVAQIARQCVVFTGSEPDRETLDTWIARFRNGAGIEDLDRHLATTTMYRDRFAGLADADFIGAAYQASLHRAPTETERTAATDGLAGGGSRSSLLSTLADEPESASLTASYGYVLAIYQAITLASPTNDELERFTSELIDCGVRVQVVEDVALTRADADVWMATIHSDPDAAF